MTNFDKNSFLNPELKYRVKPMMHSLWPDGDYAAMVEALKAFGYGGAVINPRFNKEDFVSDVDADEFAGLTELFRKEGMDYWIYDERGYPSGHAGGLTLKGHPELEAKGMYMVRRIAYEPRHTTFTIDDETDKIVWAAKYPVEVINVSRSFVQHEKMIPVPFTDTFTECDLGENEAFFIFCVKPAYEGSHCTHNVSSHRRYINIMNRDAVRRFIDIAYENTARRHPEVYKNAEAVFTDEPSLMVHYMAGYEAWPYALIPWTEGLFEAYEKEYGTSLLPYLPLLFEGQTKCYPIRVKFYRLVAKLIANAFSGQISEWCREHGTKFSGHYLCEESLLMQVASYGDIYPVVGAADYPGIDVLQCIPERYNCNTAKYIQAVARKKGTNGMMVELCPFTDKDEFTKDPWENISGTVGMLALSGVRKFNSYFRADFSSFDERMTYKGYAGKEECIKFNEYVGRLTYMLDGLNNDCNTFIYRAIEDTQAKKVPQCSAHFRNPASGTDDATAPLSKKIFAAGFDFTYADCEDLINAEKSLENGVPMISGCEVKTVIVPGVDIMDVRSFNALVALQSKGVTVLFQSKLPTCFIGGKNETDASEYFTPVTTDGIIDRLEDLDNTFTAKADGVSLLKGRFIKDGKEMYLVCNNTRGADAHVTLAHKEKTAATLYDPTDGSITPIKTGEEYVIPSFRSMFIVFD